MYGHQYTEQEKQFMKDFAPGHSYKEIQQAFTEKFGWEITMGQVKSHIHNHGLSTGRNGRFQKGHNTHNKGMKGVCAKGCEKTWFYKGHIPENHREVGSERITVDGYIEIKVAEPNVWKQKHRVVWEAEHGKVPDGYCLIFRDNDRTNTDINNLMIISRAINAVMVRSDLHRYSGEMKDVAVKIAELKIKTSAARKKKKKAGADGGSVAAAREEGLNETD